MRSLLHFLMVSIMLVVVFTIHLSAQVSLGVDIYSRYNWRGLDFGNAPSLQPSLTFSANGFSVGAWGAYNFSGGSNQNYSENDLLVSYSYETESAGTFSLMYTDYFFPGPGVSFFKYNINGSHILEAGIGYSGPKVFPVSLSFYYNFKNDPDKSDYFQIGYPLQADDISLSFFLGGTTKKSGLYLTSKSGITNVGFSATKEIKVSEKFSLPLHLFYIVNPYLEKGYLIIGLSL